MHEVKQGMAKKNFLLSNILIGTNGKVRLHFPTKTQLGDAKVRLSVNLNVCPTVCPIAYLSVCLSCIYPFSIPVHV